MTQHLALRRLVARSTALNWLQYGIAVGVALLLTPMVIGRLGATSYGVWILLGQVSGSFGLLDLGVQPAVVKFVAEERTRGDASGFQALLTTVASFYALAASTVLILGLLFIPVAERLFDVGGTPLPVFRLSMALGVLGTAVALLGACVSGALAGMQRLDLVAGAASVSHLVRAAATITALRLDLGLPGLALATLLGNGVVLFVGYRLLCAVARPMTIWPGMMSRRTLRRLFGFGLFATLGTIGWRAAYGFDALIVATLLTANDVAYYGLAASVLQMVVAAVGAFTGNLLPLASQLSARGELEGTRRAYLIGTRVSMYLGLPMLVILGALGPQILTLWVGSAVGEPAGRLVRILAFAYVALVLNAAGLPTALATGMERRAGLLFLAEGLVKLGLCVALVKLFGLTGMAVASVAVAILFAGLLWPRLITRHLGIPFRRLAREGYWPAIWPLVPAVAPVFLLAGVSWALRPMIVLGVASLSLVSYWGGCLLFGDKEGLWLDAIKERWRPRPASGPSA